MKEFFADLHTHLVMRTPEKTHRMQLDAMEAYRKKASLDYINVACINFRHGRDVSQNLAAILLKEENPRVFVHGGLVYPELPVKLPFAPEFDPALQAREMLEMGFDGIKMIEEKPAYRRDVGISLSGEDYDPYFAFLEEKQFHVLWHVNDPPNFWVRETLAPYFIEHGWCYDSPEYLSYEETYEEVYKILDRHPKLKITFAHFFFLSEDPDRLVRLFETYPNVCVDLTPGTEMYVNMAKQKKRYQEIFTRYPDRFLFGTDNYSDTAEEGYQNKNQMIRRFLETEDEDIAYGGNTYKGLGLPEEVVRMVMGENFKNRIGNVPRKMDREKEKAYFAKYLPCVKDPENRAELEKMAAFVW